MLNAPPAESHVAGFSIEVKEYEANLASGEGDHGSHLLKDGFLHLSIACDGTNPFWPEQTERTILVARLKHIGTNPDVRSQYELCLMNPDSELSSIRLEETSLQGMQHGVWLVVECVSPEAESGTEIAFGIMIEATSNVFPGEHAVH